MLASLPESCNRVNAVEAIVRLEGGNRNHKPSKEQQQLGRQQTTHMAREYSIQSPMCSLVIPQRAADRRQQLCSSYV